MITSTGNNFGAPQIEFKDYQEKDLVILNGTFQYDPLSEDYINADTLEIYLPDLQIKKSTITSVYLLSSQPEFRYGTIIKSWVKDKNTLCFEKLEYFDHYGPVTIYVCSAYPVLGYRGELNAHTASPVTLTTTAGIVEVDRRALYIKENWCYFVIGFNDFYASINGDPIAFTIDELPEGISIELPMVLKQPSIYDTGQIFSLIEIKNKTFTCASLPDSCNNSNDGDFFSAFIVY